MIETGTLLQERFLIEERIGEGGMGAVYLAVDQKFGSRVAIKETFFAGADLTDAFEREARLLNGLHHPIFPHVSDHFIENGGHFLVMEYIEGEDLSAILKRGETFDYDDVIRWTLDLLDGLDYLHSQDPPIIHRDIKPNNLKLTSRGNIVLLDFGMAKETSGNTQGMKSVFGYSRRYSPLEQIEGTGTDERSDIFSLGATIFHLLTGNPPVDVLARVSQIVAGRPDPLQLASSVNRIPPSIAAIVNSALALNAGQRFASAKAMKIALEHSLRSESEWNVPVSEPESPGGAESNLPESAVPFIASDIPIEPRVRSQYQSAVADAIGLESLTAESGPKAPELNVAEKPMPPIRIRKPFAARAAALVLACLGILCIAAFGIYRASSAGDPITQTPDHVEISKETEPETPLETSASTPDTVPDPVTEENSGPEVAERKSAISGTAKTGNFSIVEKESEKPKETAPKANSPSRPKPAVKRSPPNVRRSPSASDIESILSGDPNEDEIIFEEDRRRRRRMRRMMRENRIYPPPF